MKKTTSQKGNAPPQVDKALSGAAGNGPGKPGAAPGAISLQPARTATRPTPRAAALFAAAVPLALVIVVGLKSMWYLALYLPFGALVLILADLAMALPGKFLSVEVTLPPRLHVGQEGEVVLHLSAGGYVRPLLVEGILEYEGEADPPLARSAALKEGRGRLTLAIIPRRRGRVTVSAVWLRWRGPLNMLLKSRRQSIDQSVDVVPDVRGIHDAALQFIDRDAVVGSKSQRFKGEGTEFDNLCEYSQGMDSRFIDWKRSARHHKLLCKEFRQERNHQVVLGFDTGHLMLEPIDGIPKLDHAIKAGLLLSWISLFSGDLVGGCGFDVSFRSFLRPGRGMPYFSQFQRFTAGLDYRPEETNFTLALAELNSRIKRRALVVLFTEFVDSIAAELLLESLSIITRRHVVIFVTTRDPMLSGLIDAPPVNFSSAAGAVIADGFLRDRAVVLEKIARLGVHCLDVPIQHISTALLNRYLLIKQRGLL